MLSREFYPVPKIKPTKRKKKIEMYKGVKIPSRKQRSKIDKKNREKAMELYNHSCGECGVTTGLELHHIVFRSQSGRKGYRNLVSLCNKHRRLCHTKREYADYWRFTHKVKYGEHFYKDRFDLFKEGLIPNSTEESFERFMREQEL